MKDDDIVTSLPAVAARINRLVDAKTRQRGPRPETKTGIERLSDAHIREQLLATMTDLSTAGIDVNQPALWPPGARDEIFGFVQLAWAATAFNVPAAAHILGVSRVILDGWMQSSSFDDWTRDPKRRTTKLGSVADLALARAAELLTMQSNDPKIISQQGNIIRAVLVATAGARRKAVLDEPAPPPPPAPVEEPTPSMHDTAAPAELVPVVE